MAIPRPGSYLRFAELDETVGRALVQALCLRFRAPLLYASQDELRAARSDVRDVGDDAAPDIASVAGDTWAWYRFSQEPDGPGVLRPADVAVEKAGRWVKQRLNVYQACAQARYYQHVEYCDNRQALGDLMSRCRSRTPALFVSPVGDTVQTRSQTQAIHQVAAEFSLRVLALNDRGGVTARFGNSPADTSAAPGVSAMIGELREYFVADNRLGNLPWVLRINLGSHQQQESRARDRLLCDSLAITVHCSVDTPNEPCEYRPLWQLWAALQDLTGQAFGDRTNLGGST